MAPRQANTYDVLKCLALVAMTFDHVAFYLLPEWQWMRVIGRMAAPLFLVLVGFNGSFRFRYSLLTAAIIVSIVDAALTDIWFPQNILWTILLVRMFLHYGIARFKHREMAMIAIIFIPLTMPFLDFGSLALLFALIGYRLRQGRDYFTAGLLVVTLLLFYLWTYHIILIDLSTIQVIVLAVLLGGLGFTLWRVDFLKPITRAVTWVRFVSTHALTYYIIHKSLLQVLRLL